MEDFTSERIADTKLVCPGLTISAWWLVPEGQEAVLRCNGLVQVELGTETPNESTKFSWCEGIASNSAANGL